jgi:hypothetical protein
MTRRTYLFAGPAGSAELLTSIIETALGRPFVHEPGTDPYLRADPINIYVGGHDFDDGDIDLPDGTPVQLRTGYPCLVDVRDTERDVRRQQEAAAQIFAAIKTDGRISAVYIDDMQYVRDATGPVASGSESRRHQS